MQDKKPQRNYPRLHLIASFNSKSIQSNIKEIDWSLATENNYVDLGFKTFFKLFSRT